MSWFGADPGGIRKGKPSFGLAWLRSDGTFETHLTDCAFKAIQWMEAKPELPDGIGIDCPLWWSTWRSAERQVDVLLRRKYRGRVGQSVLSINSLRGAALVQGLMLACAARERIKDVPITETHPRALLKAMRLENGSWSKLAKTFDLHGAKPENADRLDALLSAAVARNGTKGLWNDDLTNLPRGIGEMDPQRTFCGPVNYYWFENLAKTA